MLPEFVKYIAYGLNVRLAWIVGINQNVIQIHDNKNIQLFSQNLIDVSLEGSRSVRKIKKHDMIFEMTISSLDRRLLFVAFMNSHPIIGIC